MARHIALLAGEGRMVEYVRTAATLLGDKVTVFALWPSNKQPGQPEDTVEIGAFLDELEGKLKSLSATHLLAIGSVRASPDQRRAGANWLKKAAPDELSDERAPEILDVLAQRTGLVVLGAADILPQALASDGVMAGEVPTRLSGFLLAALAAARNAGRLDFGQAVVCSGGRPIAAEGVEGTDGLIARVGEYVRAGLAGGEGSLLVLAKALRPGQPRHFDMPTVGPDTVRGCARAKIDVIALEAGGCLLVDREEMLALAEQLGVGIVGMNIDGRNR